VVGKGRGWRVAYEPFLLNLRANYTMTTDYTLLTCNIFYNWVYFYEL
jgi:hypothetical protein